jgi:dTDP-4-dehydrorhamnose reductase
MSENFKVALFGAAGQVGKDCAEALQKDGYNSYLLTRDDVDFSQPALVAEKLDVLDADIVINACAYTAVDKAETEEDLADQVNHLSVKALAEVCKKKSIPLIHISTDYVFDGAGKSPYQEDNPVNALGVYGETKLAGELAIQEVMRKFIILRTSWVFGEQGNNFVKTMLRLARDRDALSVVDDQVGRPTYVGDIVNTILHFVDKYKKESNLPWGIYHCSSEGHTSWYGFASKIFEMAHELGVLDKMPALSPIPSSAYPTTAPRPAYSVLSTEKLEKFLGRPMPHWQMGLSQFLTLQKK